MPSVFRSPMLLLVSLTALCGAAGAQESTEPPVPRAAPRGIVSEEVLPRAGGVLVFGGTEGAGLEAVKELIKRGEKVTVMAGAASDTAALKAIGVNLVAGDALVPDDLTKAFTAAPYRVVISALGGKDDDFSEDVDSNRNVVDATKAAKIPRLILVSAIGAGDSGLSLPWYLRPFRGDLVAAKTKAEAYLRASGVVYTVVRAGRLVDKPASGAATLSEDHTLFSALSRIDAGHLIADCVKNEAATSNKVLTAFDSTRASLLRILF